MNPLLFASHVAQLLEGMKLEVIVEYAGKGLVWHAQGCATSV